jgi:hypothetical protein
MRGALARKAKAKRKSETLTNRRDGAPQSDEAKSAMNVSATVFSLMAFILGFRVWLVYREKSD